MYEAVAENFRDPGIGNESLLSDSTNSDTQQRLCFWHGGSSPEDWPDETRTLSGQPDSGHVQSSIAVDGRGCSWSGRCDFVANYQLTTKINVPEKEKASRIGSQILVTKGFVELPE